ncbi:MAG: hypothetical protein AAFO15_00920 [Pseudomonadota bacterium]
MFDICLYIQTTHNIINNFITNQIIPNQFNYHLSLNQHGRYIADFYLMPITNNQFLVHISHYNIINFIKNIKKYDITNQIKFYLAPYYTQYGQQNSTAKYTYQDIRKSHNDQQDGQYFNIYSINSNKILIDNPDNIKDMINTLKIQKYTFSIQYNNKSQYTTYLQNYEEYLNNKYNNIIIDGSIELQSNISLPFKYNLNYAISFTKGCYLGQETTTKLFTQSKNKKTISNKQKINSNILSKYKNYLINQY